MSVDPKDSPFWPADNPAVIAHITLLQGIINRLASNSASCKTWCLTLVAALLTLGGSTHVPRIAMVALMPVVIFGFLDTRYLAQERAYRALFRDVVGAIREQSYSPQMVFEAQAPVKLGEFCCAFASWSVFPLYGGLILAYIVAILTGGFALLAAVPK